MWIIGLMLSSGSFPSVPESVRIAFHSFLDIRNPGTYTAPDGSRQLQGKVQASTSPQFKFTEWWKTEGETMRELFDVCNEVVVGLLHALEKVCTLFHLQALKLTRTTAGGWGTASCQDNRAVQGHSAAACQNSEPGRFSQ
jgi:hypothetical protein